MAPHGFREELHVSTLVLIVAICLAALTVVGQVRSNYRATGEEIPQMPGRALSVLSATGVDAGKSVPMPDRMLVV
jgi:hypothetical protein